MVQVLLLLSAMIENKLIGLGVVYINAMETNKSLYDFTKGEKPRNEMSFEYDSKQGLCTVDVKFKNRQATVDISAPIGETYRGAKILPHKKRNHDVLSLSHRYDSNGNEISDIGLDVADGILTEFEQKLSEHKQAVEQWESEARERAENTELKFEVTEHEYTTGWRTKYRHTDVVLIPNKVEDIRTEEENEIAESLINKHREADEYPVVADDFEVGEILTAKDFEIDDEVEYIREEKKRERKRTSILNKYPDLFDVEFAFDPFDFEIKKKTAKEEDEKIEVANTHDECNDRSKECNLDLITYYITPQGEIDVERVHTY